LGREAVFITTATALLHELNTFTPVLRSTQPSTLRGMGSHHYRPFRPV